MKRLDFNSDNAHIVKIASAPSLPTDQQKPNFDLSKLLQILPKLNLGGLLGNQNSTNQSDNIDNYSNFNDEFLQSQNLMTAHNVALAKSSLEAHTNLVNKLHENQP